MPQGIPIAERDSQLRRDAPSVYHMGGVGGPNAGAYTPKGGP